MADGTKRRLSSWSFALYRSARKKKEIAVAVNAIHSRHFPHDHTFIKRDVCF
jgi:hypothetical protein